jgi:ferredoxin
MTGTGYRYLPGVVTLHLDPVRCNGCKLCMEVCPHGVFVVENQRAEIIDRDACMECGACARNCESGAITVQSGVGCATAIIYGALTGSEPTCGSDEPAPTCCG